MLANERCSFLVIRVEGDLTGIEIILVSGLNIGTSLYQ